MSAPATSPAGSLGGAAIASAPGAADPLGAWMEPRLAAYRPRIDREDVASTRELSRLAGGVRPPVKVVVVGSNGKTTTATLISRGLRGRARTGLFTSPHLRRWTERILVDGAECGRKRLKSEFDLVHRVAREETDPSLRPQLRFFDALAVTADRIFGSEGVEIGVYEAGIGGRRDAVAALDPDLVVLTSVALEHTELLGTTREAILEEKLGVAPRGATVVVPRLGGGLDGIVERRAAERELRLVAVGSRDTGPAEQSAALAGAAIEQLGRTGGLGHADLRAASVAVDPGETPIEGRRQRIEVGGVPVLLDVAHNPAAWEALFAEAEVGEVALVALTRPRDPSRFADLIAASTLREVVATSMDARPARRPEVIGDELAARGIDAVAVPERHDAYAAALQRAGRSSGPLLVFGSTYLVGEFLDWTETHRVDA